MQIAMLSLRDGDREELVPLTPSSTVMAASAQRALVVLLAVAGGVEHWDRCADRGVAADNARVAGPFRAVGIDIHHQVQLPVGWARATSLSTRGTLCTMRELISAISTFITGWNNRATSSSGPSRRLNPQTTNRQRTSNTDQIEGYTHD